MGEVTRIKLKPSKFISRREIEIEDVEVVKSKKELRQEYQQRLKDQDDEERKEAMLYYKWRCLFFMFGLPLIALLVCTISAFAKGTSIEEFESTWLLGTMFYLIVLPFTCIPSEFLEFKEW